MSIGTISWNVPFGTANYAFSNLKNNNAHETLKTGLQNTGACGNFKGLAALPAAAAGATSGAEAISAGAIGATGALGALGAAITAGLVSCGPNLKNSVKEASNAISKNAPKVILTI